MVLAAIAGLLMLRSGPLREDYRTHNHPFTFTVPLTSFDCIEFPLPAHAEKYELASWKFEQPTRLDFRDKTGHFHIHNVELSSIGFCDWSGPSRGGDPFTVDAKWLPK